MRSISIRANNQYANKKIIRRMLIIVSLLTLVLLAVFWIIAFENLNSRAENSIRLFLNKQDRYYEDISTFPVFELTMGENVEKAYYSGDLDEALNNLYLSHPEEFSMNVFRRYQNGDTFVVYYPAKVSSVFSLKSGKIPDYTLLYCDITYEMKRMNNNMLVTAAVLAAFILLLFLVSRNTLKTLDKKDEQMKNFFANASHELKTPLMAIKGNADGIGSGYVKPEEGCAVIEKEADRMSGLISSILDLSRLDSGMMEPDIVRTDVREIVYDAVSSVMQEAAHRNLTVDVDLKDPVFRDCDESMLYSAFSNILTNDIRYARKEIRIFSEPVQDNKVRFMIENDGTPISEEDREHIFDRFYKGGNGQTGLGMALAQEYVKLHGSVIVVEAGENKTIFSIVL